MVVNEKYKFDFNSLTEELKYSSNPFLRTLFPFSTSRLLEKITTDELDDLFYKLLKALNIDFLIECGAHEATASLNFIKQGGKSIAIEANPFIFNNITPASIDNLISINVALSNKKGKLNFYFPKNNNKSGQSTFLPKKGVEYEMIEVNTIELDELLKTNGIENQNICFWIDVEGLQKEVLEGASFFLKKNCSFIKIEVESKETFVNQKWLVDDINNYLKKNDFIPVFRDFEFDTQFNVLYIKKNFLEETSTLINYSKNNIKKKLNIKKILIFLLEDQNLLREIKQVFINIFGSKIGNIIAGAFGSKSSLDFLKSK